MKAALYDATGPARDVLKVTEIERPEPGPGEVRVRAAGADLVLNYRQQNVAGEVRAYSGRADRVVEVALGMNLETDLAVSGPETVIVTYAATPPDPVLPVRSCMSANVTLRFVLLYTVPAEAVDQAVAGITAALREGALTPLPVHHFRLDEIAAAHEAVEKGVTGKVLVLIGDSPDR